MNNKKWAAVIGVLALTVVIGWRTFTGKRTSDEEQIHLIIYRCVEGFREKNIGDCMDNVGSSFVGRAGSRSVSKGELKQFLTFRVLRGGGLEIRILTQDIHVTGDTARAELRAVMAKGGLSGVAEGKVAAKEVDLSFARVDGDWKIVGSSYRNAL